MNSGGADYMHRIYALDLSGTPSQSLHSVYGLAPNYTYSLVLPAAMREFMQCLVIADFVRHEGVKPTKTRTKAV
jgi:hypothetical protein